jgi:hypothetical protein
VSRQHEQAVIRELSTDNEYVWILGGYSYSLAKAAVGIVDVVIKLTQYYIIIKEVYVDMLQ